MEVNDMAAELKKIDEELKVLGRGAMFMGFVAQKSLLDVITEPEKPVLKEKPKGCHGACKSFAKASYGTGSCKLDKNPVVPTERGCKDWKSAASKQLLVESLHKKLKTLMSMG
jgi:hypothetical protein